MGQIALGRRGHAARDQRYPGRPPLVASDLARRARSRPADRASQLTWTPPYFPGYADLWDNIFLGRLASHPWGAMRFIAGVIGGGLMDKYPTLRVGTLECGFGWLPFWGRRMDEQYAYVGSTQQLKMKPSEYLSSGRYFCSVERHEGADMYHAVASFIGEDVLMYASDYPHSECQFPETVDNFLKWDVTPAQRQKLMAGNAGRFFTQA